MAKSHSDDEVTRLAGVFEVIEMLHKHPWVAFALVAFIYLVNSILLFVDDAARGILSPFLFGPVVLAGVLFGIRGGLIVGMLAGLLLVPGLHLWTGEVESGSGLALAGLFVDMLWLCLVGLVIGTLSQYASHVSGQLAAFHGAAAQQDMPGYASARDQIKLLIDKSPRPGADPTVSVTSIRVANYSQLAHLHGARRAEIMMGELSERIKSIMPASAHISRTRADSFTLVDAADPNWTADGHMQHLEAVRNTPFDFDGIPVFADLTSGLAVSSSDDTDPDQLLSNAGIVLEDALARGLSGNIHGADGGPAGQADQVRLMGEVGRAIADGELCLVYQPKLDLHTGTFIGLEALVRWKHPDRGYVPPHKFIPLIEETHMIHRFTAWVIEEAIGRIADWQAAGLNPTVAINLSTRNLMDRTLLGKIPHLLAAKQVEAHRLELEISERAIMTLRGSQLQRLRELKELGVCCTVDNFGSGHASLTHLRTLPVSTVKLQANLFRSSSGRIKDAGVTRSIVQLAHDLGLVVVAEGVETAKHLREVQSLGCDQAQGFFIAKPIGHEGIPDLLSNRWLHPAVE